ncbi:polysaccharide pyruvyl transferase family protein [Celeribacter halophilus]|uniref:Polysaccharide pyruvyl transferase n=1 Tax=Celeribacter halophilus TaxID=576117 RepID=A0A1I3WHP6_9RHOB|nr:polysaccharide pyruvyl transferase family protein [Celeribacter halophilus]PZX09856.1 polysaccharide pyruvyl transferase [Celeribacter halophilus]SFK06683.1 Polysaccharide pyruvyl transferase [Celeribacter halophilus]
MHEGNETKSAPPIEAFFFLKTKFENAGDALINHQLIRIVSQTVPVTVEASLAPEHFIQNMQLENVQGVEISRRGLAYLAITMLKRRARGIRPVLFLMPGGNSGEKSRKLFWLNEAYTGFLAFLRMLGINIVSVGASYENLGVRYQRIIRHRLKLASKVIVRDQISAGELAKAGVTIDGILPDLAFGLDFACKEGPNSLVSQPTGMIAFSFRTDEPYYSTAKIKQMISKILADFPEAPIKFVAQVESDIPFMKELYAFHSPLHHAPVSFVDITASLSEFRDKAYGDVTVLFSNRLHALLLGLAAGSIPVACLHQGYDQKIRGVFDMCGLSNCIADIDTSNLQKLYYDDFQVSSDAIASIKGASSLLTTGITDILYELQNEK